MTHSATLTDRFGNTVQSETMTSNRRLSTNMILEALEVMLDFEHLYYRQTGSFFISLENAVNARDMGRDLKELPASEITRAKVKEIVVSYIPELPARFGSAEKVRECRAIVKYDGSFIYPDLFPVCTELEFERFVNWLMTELKVDGWYGL